MAITPQIKLATINAAKAAGIPAAALLAVVEIESSGAPFEPDGRTPRFLFERHIFYKELAKRAPDKLDRAKAQGLAIPQWNKATQYRDQGTASGRAILLSNARAVDVECANRSASWGLGQIMGFNAEACGFGSATAFVAFISTGGVAAQIECMVRFIRGKRLIGALVSGNWAAFAAGFNGPGYRQNNYDGRLAAAERKWKGALDPNDTEDGSEPVPLLQSKAPEPAPMTQSTIGNAAVGTGTLGVAAIASQVWDKLTELPDSITQALIAAAHKPAFWIGVAVVGGTAFIWWRRMLLKRDAGV